MNRYSDKCPLRRLGKKNVIAPILANYVPDNFDCLISLFYGTGSFENNYIGKIKYLFANDLDNNVFNLYQVLQNNTNELIEEIETLPVGDASWKFFKKYKEMELTPIKKALFFLYYSNFGCMGKPESLKYGLRNNKKQLLKNIKGFYKDIVTNEKTSIQYLNCDYTDIFRKISFRDDLEKEKSFVFADPPYVGCADNYDTPKWTIQDHENLQNHLINSGFKFMICEFDNPQVIEIAIKNKLNITYISERRNMKNRRTEIILTNYILKQNYQNRINF